MITFFEIDVRRRENKFSQKILCQRAAIHETTYCRLKKGELCGNVKTLGALNEACLMILTDLVLESNQSGSESFHFQTDGSKS